MIISVDKQVADYLRAVGVDATVAFGWSEVGRQDTQATGGAGRVIFVPAEDSGELEGTHYPGAALFDLMLRFTVHVWARDPDDEESDRAQANATLQLFHWVVRAVSGLNRPQTLGRDVATHNGAETWGSLKWVSRPTEFSFGRSLTIPLTLRIPLSDVPDDTVFPGFVLDKTIIS